MINALTAAATPRSVLLWMRKDTSGAALLRDMLAAGYPITHELLDTFPGRQAAVHLRHLLVHVGILPERDEYVASMELWLKRYLADTQAHHRGILQPYAQWVVLRRVRHQARTRGNSRSSINYARSQVSATLDFLKWVEAQKLTLASVTQAEVDRWLAEGATSRRRLRDFLRWARRCHLVDDLHVPWQPDGEPANFLDEDEHLALLHRCINDPALPLDVRTAGSLILLYGLPVTRVAQLTHQNVEKRGVDSYIRLGEHAVVLPPALARLLDEQMRVPVLSVVERRTPRRQDGWLFPGALVGRSIDGSKLSGKLLRHGIDVRPARNTALMTLASDLPAPILSKILGIHINTAVDWVSYVKRDWSSYIAARETATGFHGALRTPDE
ncbi:hypothetical protein J5Y04_29305 [Kitasatospora sp. RG8]|uniref:hypothetical protein n=1 Tax=Kitasatospora sp. RG8 TaxID=2820815 RepID=UPI001AE05928|nr:hypothetical protein [Kitasatospora sp. RG8]MBP0453611.1 hypothetical protein [Kitasatospora sp. RG8]